MPDTKLKDVTEVTTPILDAFIYTVHSPTGANTDYAETPANFLKVVDLLTEDASPVAGDFVLGYDTSAGGAKKVDYANMGAAIGAGLTANPLSQFAATTSSQLAGVLSDPTGSGPLVFATSPTLVTPVLGTPSSGALGSCTAYEGTAVASTGEAGGTKYLREDGDGSCSWQTPAGSGDFLADGTVAMTADLNLDGNNVDNVGVLMMKEQAAADSDLAASGQLWVKTATPNQLWFTDDLGGDTQLGTGAGSLTNWTESTGTETTVYTAFLSTNAATDVHAVISPKGAGALIADIPDGTSAGGNDRGANAVDLQTSRNQATMVASGAKSGLFCGEKNIASGESGGVFCGSSNNATGLRSGVFSGLENDATGDSCGIFSGYNNANAGTYSSILAGTGNTCDSGGSNSAIVCGASNTVNGDGAVILSGLNNEIVAAATHCVAHGYYARASRYNESAHGLKGSAEGQAQLSRWGASIVTTDATETEVTINSTRLTIPANGVLTGVVRVSARRTDAAGESDGWHMEFCVENDGGTTALVGSPSATQHGSSTWAISIEADDTNDAIIAKVTGEASKDIRWVVGFDFVQVHP